MSHVGGRRVTPTALRRALAGVALGAALVTGLSTGLVPGLVADGAAATSASQAAPGDDALYLVTLVGPGAAGYRGRLPRAVVRSRMRDQQDAALALADAGAPLYRWTTALNGFAARLTPAQAQALDTDPEVALIERNAVRRLAGRPGAFAASSVPPRQQGGAGVVIGFVDSGLGPDNPLFAAVPHLGRSPRRFHGTCSAGQDWTAETCNRKVVGARFFVGGFGADHVRSSSSLSALDDDGHGTQMASIAAGNAGVSVDVPGQRLGPYGGVAPQARIAVYKACWTAPDPSDDGCATADLVAAIDQATRDGVDVLNLSVAGPPRFDTVERALLGAAESDIVVVAAAGNAGSRAFAAHASPWVTTVGGTTGVRRRGQVVVPGATFTGAMASTRPVGPARLVLGSRAAAPSARRADAAVCKPGSLDAAAVSGAVVFCERGGIGRVAKSAAVRQADGVGMVLANVRAGSVDADLHSVPTVHLDRASAVQLRRWLATHPHGRISLRSLGVEHERPRVTHWSAAGDPFGAVLKPDLVAPAEGVLGAVPPAARGNRWDFVSGTSAATAFTSGTAALLLRDHHWSAAAVRSALATSAADVAGRSSELRTGAGLVRPDAALHPGLVYDVRPRDYRAWLDGALPSERLNTPSIQLTGDHDSAVRTVTNVGRRAMYYSSSASGFRIHRVHVTPAAIRLAPGASATFRVSVLHPGGVHPLDDGWVTWLGANGTRVRIPVVLSR